MTNRILARSSLAAAILVPLLGSLAGCDPQPSGPTSPGTPGGTTLTITPSLGMVRNATVVVKNASGTVVGGGSTNNSGQSVVTASGSGPFIVEVQGDADATYFDEAAGTFLPFPAPRVIHALVPTGTTHVGVTGLTEVAHALWAGNSVPLSNTNINAANNAVLTAFAPSAPAGLNNLLTPPNPLASTPSGNLTANAADMYAALLGTLADLGTGRTAPALAVIDQLRRDATDGSLDGMEGSTAITGLLYSGGIVADFNAAFPTRVSAWGNTALRNATSTFTVTALAEPTWTGGGGGGGGGDVPATLNGGLDGTYTVTFALASGASQSELPYVDGQDYSVTVDSSTGTLSIYNISPPSIIGVPYTAPFYRNGGANTASVVWFQPGIDLEWELDNNDTGLFHEITLYAPFPSDGSGIPVLLGQFSLSTNGGGGGGGGTPVDCSSQASTVFAAKAGTYTFTAGTVTGLMANRFTSGNTYSVTLTDQGYLTVETILGSVDLHDYSDVQDCATTPRIVYVAENGLPPFTLTFDAAASTNATLEFTDTINSASATLDGVQTTSGGGGGGGSTTDEQILAQLNGRNGHMFNINGGAHVWTLEDAQVYKYSPSGKRALMFDNYYDDTPDMTTVNGATVYNSEITLNTVVPGTQNCGAGGANVMVQLSGGVAAGAYNATACEIHVTHMSRMGGAEGVIVSATLSNGTQTITLANSPFRVYMHMGSAGNVPAITDNEFATVGITASGAPEFKAGTHFLLNHNGHSYAWSSTGYQMDPNDGSDDFSNGISWLYDNAFFSGSGPFNCGTIYTASTRMNMYVTAGVYDAEDVFSTQGGSCSINITSRAGPFHQGSYTATLVRNDSLLPTAQNTISIAGEFRNYTLRTHHAGGNGNEGTLGATQNGITMGIDNGSAHLAQGESFLFPIDSSAPSGSTVTVEGWRRAAMGTPEIKVSLDRVPQTVGSHICGSAGMMDVRFDTGQGMTYGVVDYQAGNYVARSGASCSVIVTEGGNGVIAGTYTATMTVPSGELVMPNNDNLITISGAFRRAVVVPQAP